MAIFIQHITLVTAAVIGTQSVGAVVLTSSVRGTLIDICSNEYIIIEYTVNINWLFLTITCPSIHIEDITQSAIAFK